MGLLNVQIEYGTNKIHFLEQTENRHPMAYLEVWSMGVCVFNPLRAKFLRENINIYLHFMSFLHADKTHVVEIPPQVRQGPAYST